jgi:hypothetical protein
LFLIFLYATNNEKKARRRVLRPDVGFCGHMSGIAGHNDGVFRVKCGFWDGGSGHNFVAVFFEEAHEDRSVVPCKTYRTFLGLANIHESITDFDEEEKVFILDPAGIPKNPILDRGRSLGMCRTQLPACSENGLRKSSKMELEMEQCFSQQHGLALESAAQEHLLILAATQS